MTWIYLVSRRLAPSPNAGSLPLLLMIMKLVCVVWIYLVYICHMKLKVDSCQTNIWYGDYINVQGITLSYTYDVPSLIVSSCIMQLQAAIMTDCGQQSLCLAAARNISKASTIAQTDEWQSDGLRPKDASLPFVY